INFSKEGVLFRLPINEDLTRSKVTKIKLRDRIDNKTQSPPEPAAAASSSTPSPSVDLTGYPKGLPISPDGTIYVVDNHTGELAVIPPGQTAPSQFIHKELFDDEPFTPSSLTIFDNELFVTGSTKPGHTRIFGISLPGGTVRHIAGVKHKGDAS